MTWFRKPLFIFLGLLALLLLLRGAEYAFDLKFGDGDGKMTSSGVSFGLDFACTRLLLLLAVTNWDFRFMYPATLSMQLITFAHVVNIFGEQPLRTWIPWRFQFRH